MKAYFILIGKFVYCLCSQDNTFIISSKVQKHNNVHVEIFIGGETGLQTIGARYSTGKIQVFPSYKFESSKWSLVNYHFRSLETWLDGKCESCCPEHPWISSLINLSNGAGSKSIFYCDDEDVACGDYIDEVGSQDGDMIGGGDSDTTPVPEKFTKEDNSKINDLSTSGLGSALNDTSHQSKDRDEDAASPPPAASLSISRGPLRSMSLEDKVAMSNLKSEDGSTISTMRSNNNKSLTNSTSRTCSSSFDSTSNTADTQITRTKSHDKERSLPPNSYYLTKTNGWRLVKSALDKRGWQQLPFEYGFSTRYSLRWVERRSQIDFKSHVAGQVPVAWNGKTY